MEETDEIRYSHPEDNKGYSLAIGCVNIGSYCIGAVCNRRCKDSGEKHLVSQGDSISSLQIMIIRCG